MVSSRSAVVSGTLLISLSAGETVGRQLPGKRQEAGSHWGGCQGDCRETGGSAAERAGETTGKAAGEMAEISGEAAGDTARGNC